MSSLCTKCSLKEVLGEFESDVLKGVIQYKILSRLGTFVSFLSCFGDEHCGLKVNVVDCSLHYLGLEK